MNLGVWPMAALGFAFVYVMSGAGSSAVWQDSSGFYSTPAAASQLGGKGGGK